MNILIKTIYFSFVFNKFCLTESFAFFIVGFFLQIWTVPVFNTFEEFSTKVIAISFLFQLRSPMFGSCQCCRCQFLLPFRFLWLLLLGSARSLLWRSLSPFRTSWFSGWPWSSPSPFSPSIFYSGESLNKILVVHHFRFYLYQKC